MLGEVNGRTQFVFTGVTVVFPSKTVTFSVRSEVTFRDMSEEEIAHYVDTHHPYDKAGGSAIQEGVFVRAYKGRLTNIIGMPTEKLVKGRKEVQSGADRSVG